MLPKAPVAWETKGRQGEVNLWFVDSRGSPLQANAQRKEWTAPHPTTVSLPQNSHQETDKACCWDRRHENGLPESFLLAPLLQDLCYTSGDVLLARLQPEEVLSWTGVNLFPNWFIVR